MGLEGALFFVCTNQVMMMLNSSVLQFQLERHIFLRE
jgi:ABC-type multidrug transport system permease subunit